MIILLGFFFSKNMIIITSNSYSFGTLLSGKWSIFINCLTVEGNQDLHSLHIYPKIFLCNRAYCVLVGETAQPFSLSTMQSQSHQYSEIQVGIPESRHGAPCRKQCSTMDSWQRFRASVWWGAVDEPNLKDILHISNDQVFPNYTPRPSKGTEEMLSVKSTRMFQWSLNYYYIYSFDLLCMHKCLGDGCHVWREARGRLDSIRSPFPSCACRSWSQS